MFSRDDLSFIVCTRACLASESLVSMGPSPCLWFLHANHRLLDQHTSLYWSQTSPVVLCMYKSVLSIGITSLYWTQPSSVVFACKTSTFGPAYKSLLVPDLTCRFVHVQRACLASELLVSIGPSPHLWFLHAKQRVLDQNNKSLCFPEMTCHFLYVQERA